MQEQEVGSAGIQTVGWKMHLLRRGQVHEPGVREGIGAVLATLLGALPVGFRTNM